MEISSFPFLNQEDLSHFYSLFQDMDTVAPFGASLNNNNNNNNNTDNLKKRRRKDDEEEEEEFSGFFVSSSPDELKNKGAMREVLASILLLDEEEKQEHQQWLIESEQDKALLDLNHEQKVQTLSDYQDQFKTHYTNVGDLDQSRTKRARRDSSAAAVAAVVSETTASEPDSIQNSCGPAVTVAATGGQQRRLWVKDRSKDWWEKCNSPDFPEEEFKKAFRMSKATFDMVCEQLDSAVTKKNTMLRDAIPVRQRVAVCIWRLATGEPLRLVSKRFGLGISTCHKLVLEVCSAIKNVLMPKFLQWPGEEKLRRIKAEFEAISGIPNVAGSMHTTHIPIIAPKINVAAYFNKRHTERNQKTSYSMTVQGVVDPKGVFLDVCIGYPGSMSDEKVLEESALYKRASRGALKNVAIAGSAGYPLMDWVLVPYTHQNLTWTQHTFNEKIGEVESVSKEAFARLKGRWSCLQKRTEVKLQDLPVVLGACCVLHNICEMRNEEVLPEQKFEIFDDEMIPENSIRSVSAAQARDQLAHNLLHRGIVGNNSFL